MAVETYLTGPVAVAGHGGVGAITLRWQVCSGSYPSDLAVRRTGPWRCFLARLSPLKPAAVLDLAGRRCRREDARSRTVASQRRRPEPLDRATRWPKLHAVLARGSERRQRPSSLSRGARRRRVRSRRHRRAEEEKEKGIRVRVVVACARAHRPYPNGCVPRPLDLHLTARGALAAKWATAEMGSRGAEGWALRPSSVDNCY